MAQHTIMLSLTVSDREYIQIIQAQQKSGKYTVESYLRGILMDTLSTPKPAKKKVKAVESGTVTSTPAPVKKKKNGQIGVSAAEVMAALGSDADGASGIATAEPISGG